MLKWVFVFILDLSCNLIFCAGRCNGLLTVLMSHLNMFNVFGNVLILWSRNVDFRWCGVRWGEFVMSFVLIFVRFSHYVFVGFMGKVVRWVRALRVTVVQVRFCCDLFWGLRIVVVYFGWFFWGHRAGLFEVVGDFVLFWVYTGVFECKLSHGGFAYCVIVYFL